jgi:hypothetical protein
MKRLLSVCLLMLCLSFPAYAGHTVAGGYACSVCPCNDCICDPGDVPMQCNSMTAPTKNETKRERESVDFGSSIFLALITILVMARIRN